jgi:hypothetical protein
MDAELLVSSPLKRPLQTAILGYPDLRTRLEAEGKRMIILPQLQEVSIFAGFIQSSHRFPQLDDFPCDIGSVRWCHPLKVIDLDRHRHLNRLVKSWKQTLNSLAWILASSRLTGQARKVPTHLRTAQSKHGLYGSEGGCEIDQRVRLLLSPTR